MPFSNYGEERCVNIWRYCTAVLQIVTFGRQSVKQFTELQRVSSWNRWLFHVWCAQREEKMLWEQDQWRMSGSTVAYWNGISWALQSAGAICAAATVPADGGTAQRGHPEGAGLKWEFSFDVWSQNQLPAEPLQASSWKVFLCKWPLSLH